VDILSQQWNALPSETRTLLTRIALALITLLLVWALRRLLAAIVVTPLRRLVKRMNVAWGEMLLDAITGPARLVIIALGVAVGAQILQLDAVAATFIQHFIRMLLILAVFWAAYRAVGILAPSSANLFRLTGLAVNDRLLPFVRTAVRLVLAALALVIIIQEWGYDVSGLIAGLGLGGLAFSLAAKDTVENLFGFTTIVGDQPFVVGDFIKSGDIEGTVERVGVRSTRIRQADQAYVTVPNNKLASAPVLNWSRLHKRWLDFRLVITYEAHRSDLETLLERIRAMLAGREQVEPDSVIVRLFSFGENGFEVLVRCYITLIDWSAYAAEREAINLEILRLLEAGELHLASRVVKG
jgi:MscS family membrane protein